MARYHVFGVPLNDCYGWGQPIHAPSSGSVVAAEDGWPERRRLHFVSDLAVVIKNAFTFDPARPRALQMVCGNHIILRMPDTDVHALLAHARTGSVRVKRGQDGAVGDHLADVGHSGNSTAPHLHFHLMRCTDESRILDAVGVPCAFRSYEVLRDGVWSTACAGVPAKREFIRYAA
jgi:murein DD-endopeptidase MepM/ murein hydrolase activator NlpD